MISFGGRGNSDDTYRQQKKPRVKSPLGQVFTPAPVADLMISLTSKSKDARVLEPCAGGGGLPGTDSDTAGFSNVTAVEIDESLVAGSTHPIIPGSFLSTPLPEDEFDLVIGSPPYVRMRDLDPALRDELQGHVLWRTYFTSLSDYLTIFVARAVELLADDGELVFITPSFWMHTQHSESLREFMLARGQVERLLYFGKRQYSRASAHRS